MYLVKTAILKETKSIYVKEGKRCNSYRVTFLYTKCCLDQIQLPTQRMVKSQVATRGIYIVILRIQSRQFRGSKPLSQWWTGTWACGRHFRHLFMPVWLALICSKRDRLNIERPGSNPYMKSTLQQYRRIMLKGVDHSGNPMDDLSGVFNDCHPARDLWTCARPLRYTWGRARYRWTVSNVIA